jgi:hypothetical protein
MTPAERAEIVARLELYTKLAKFIPSKSELAWMIKTIADLLQENERLDATATVAIAGLKYAEAEVERLTQRWERGPIFVLYGGQSVDGSGPGTYEGFTLDRAVAIKHFKGVKANPYSTGFVEVLTPTRSYQPFDLSELEREGGGQ